MRSEDCFYPFWNQVNNMPKTDKSDVQCTRHQMKNRKLPQRNKSQHLARRFVLRNKTEITEVAKSPVTVIQSIDSVVAVIQLARTAAVSTTVTSAVISSVS